MLRIYLCSLLIFVGFLFVFWDVLIAESIEKNCKYIENAKIDYSEIPLTLIGFMIWMISLVIFACMGG